MFENLHRYRDGSIAFAFVGYRSIPVRIIARTLRDEHEKVKAVRSGKIFDRVLQVGQLPRVVVAALAFSVEPNDERIFFAGHDFGRAAQPKSDQLVVVPSARVTITEGVETVDGRRVRKETFPRTVLNGFLPGRFPYIAVADRGNFGLLKQDQFPGTVAYGRNILRSVLLRPR
ncbi:MAG TPA: hypothetical protein DEB39_08145 [Planctomycetaceae bacterium]|nr:hypothetical protein [Planctomycetaceae bacterium]